MRKGPASANDEELAIRMFVSAHQGQNGLGIGEGLLENWRTPLQAFEPTMLTTFLKSMDGYGWKELTVKI